MATLTATEQRRLGLIRPEMMQQLLQLMDAAGALGLRVYVPDDGGYRSSAKQQALYADSLAQGGGSVLAYPVGKPGTSYHEYGAAVDLHILDGKGSDENYQALADLARQQGLTAGYYFSNSDPYHFQLNESLLDAQVRWRAMRRVGIVRDVALSLIVAAVLVGVARR